MGLDLPMNEELQLLDLCINDTTTAKAGNIGWRRSPHAFEHAYMRQTVDIYHV